MKAQTKSDLKVFILIVLTAMFLTAGIYKTVQLQNTCELVLGTQK